VTDAAVPALAAPGGARWRASLWDHAAILCWLAILTVAGLVLRTVLPPAPSYLPVVAGVVALLLTVAPVWAFLTVGEAGRHAAGWGKRRAGLRVVGPDGGRSGSSRVAVRNAVKLLPWQLAHVAVAGRSSIPRTWGRWRSPTRSRCSSPRAASSWPDATPSTGRRTIASPAPGS
jgi:uncharacterized RDD family membrane protein YckC